jgi:hypothetical protein
MESGYPNGISLVSFGGTGIYGLGFGRTDLIDFSCFLFLFAF